MKATGSSEIFVFTHKTTQHHIQTYSILKSLPLKSQLSLK
jgi:hypothetical protein